MDTDDSDHSPSTAQKIGSQPPLNSKEREDNYLLSLITTKLMLESLDREDEFETFTQNLRAFHSQAPVQLAEALQTLSEAQRDQLKELTETKRVKIKKADEQMEEVSVPRRILNIKKRS